MSEEATRALVEQVLGRPPTEAEEHEWMLRGLTDAMGERIGDGLERNPTVSLYVGGETYKRVLDFGEVPGADGRSLRVSLELVRGVPDEGGELRS